MEFWRISNYADLSGRGGELSSGRWHTKPRRVVYAADSAAASLLEIVVKADVTSNEVPESYQLMVIKAPGLSWDSVPSPQDLGANWRDDEGATRRVGDAFLDACSAPVLRVPSAIAPATWNFLINPNHEAVKAFTVEVSRHAFDPRLFPGGGVA